MSTTTINPFSIADNVVTRGLESGPESLNEIERIVFSTEKLCLDLEMGGLSAFFYNHLPDPKGELPALTRALETVGAKRMAATFTEACEIFSRYGKSRTLTTWENDLKRHDPDNRLEGLSNELRKAYTEEYPISEYIEANSSKFKVI